MYLQAALFLSNREIQYRVSGRGLQKIKEETPDQEALCSP